MRFETLAVHAGSLPEETGVAPPLQLSTTYLRDTEGVPVSGHTYIRDSNPTQSQLEAALAPLEGGEAALVFASGLAAGAALLQTLATAASGGVDRVLFPDDLYYGFRVMAQEYFPRWGLRASFLPMADLAALERALEEGGTRLVWLESPSNPQMKITDLAAAAALARAAGALTLVDNTFATPALQRPFELGADLVLHSATKYFGGHSDVQGGCLVFSRDGELPAAVQHTRHTLGAVASPFNSWLILRGLKTLACRMQVHCTNALAVARALEDCPAVSAVHYPGLPSHPGHEIAARQMSGFGGMLSFRAREGKAAALRAVSRARLFLRATSLGGVESLIEHRATSEGPTSVTPQDLIRLSIGVEHPDDLIADLMQALDA